MAQQLIGLGTTAGDGTGDTLRSAGAKFNAMFGDLYQPVGASYMPPVAMAALRSGLYGASSSAASRFKLALLGDSTMAGVGAGTGGTSNANGARARVWPAQIAKLLTAAGIPAQINSVMGESNMTQFVTYPNYDPRVTFGAGFVTNSISCPGGSAFTFTNVGGGGFNNASSTFSFTPENPFDSFEVFWRQRGGSVTVNVDGGAALTPSVGLGVGGSTITIPGSYASFGNGRSQFTGLTLGSHTVNIVVQSGTTTDIAGVHAWNSTIGYVDIIPICASGGKISTFDDSSYFGGSAYITSWMPIDYILSNITVNDTAPPTTAAAYTASLTDMMSKYSLGGGFTASKFGHMIGPYISAMGADISQSTIGAAILAFAKTNNQPVFDFASRWISGATGLTGGDGVHPSFAGTSDIA